MKKLLIAICLFASISTAAIANNTAKDAPADQTTTTTTETKPADAPKDAPKK